MPTTIRDQAALCDSLIEPALLVDGDHHVLHANQALLRGLKDGATLPETLGALNDALPEPATTSRFALGEVDIVLLGRSHRLEDIAGDGYWRAVRSLTECGRAVIRAKSEPALLAEICRIIVEVVGYRLAWIGFLDDGDMVNAVAETGFAPGFLVNHQVTINPDDPLGWGVVGQSLRARRPHVIRDAKNASDYKPYAELAERYQFEALAGLPLMHGGEPFGVLCIYSSYIDAFDDAELQLLEEVSIDLAYGINNLRTQEALAEQRKAVEAINQELDDRVRRRTAELEKARAELEADVAERQRAEQKLLALNEELVESHAHLAQAQNQLVQSEKMASLGQLAAGVAHEINNPISFVSSNLGTLKHYNDTLLELITAAEQACHALDTDSPARQHFEAISKRADLDFIREDVASLLAETQGGIKRVRDIVADLRAFSHAGSGQWRWADLHETLNATLNIAQNEYKNRIRIEKRYGELPQVQCQPSQLSQVFMNLIVNAAQSIEGEGEIILETAVNDGWVTVSVSDTGSGIDPAHMNRIFDAFFTTKDVGQGTGLGLSLSYTIVQRHGGRIEVDSKPGQGSRFTVVLPVKQAGGDDEGGDRD